MGRKAQIKNIKRMSKKTNILLDLQDIMDPVALKIEPEKQELPPGFLRYQTDKCGKVSPFSKDLKNMFTYDYPKKSPFKFVTKTKSSADKIYSELIQATKRGLVNKAYIQSNQKTLEHLQKNLQLLDDK